MVRNYRVEVTNIGQRSPTYINYYVQNVIDKILQTDNINKIGDIGCGIGFHSNLLKEKYRNTSFIGVDFSKATIEYLKNNTTIFDELFLCSSKKLPITDKYFDIAISMENLEHLYYEDVIDALYELKRTGKYIIITTPTPSRVVNIPWLNQEINEAKNDSEPLTEHDYLCLESCVHKSTLHPDSLILAGFKQEIRYGTESECYYAYSEDVDLDKIRFNGIKQSSLPNDCPYNDRYLDLLKKSLHMITDF